MAPKLTIFNHYGPTEATVGMLTYCLENDENTYKSTLVPLGRPLPNVQAYLLDSSLATVPVGVTGVLHSGGACLARGYLNSPELTAEKFIPNPFSQESAARLYKTGDLARYSPDGNLEFLGRTDHQVKIHGFRIELEEIEAALAQHQLVGEVVVLAKTDLVAYIVPKHKQKITGLELRRFLEEKLPNYMIPSRFVLVTGFPRTTHGKLDRRALPALDTARSEPESDFVAPRTPPLCNTPVTPTGTVASLPTG